MPYMRRGNSGLIVSALAFGAMTLGSPLAGGFLNGKYTRENLGQSDPGFEIRLFAVRQRRSAFKLSRRSA
jgi:aryl-alcohol dehydrogenase-like predicted oxidoreductase